MMMLLVKVLLENTDFLDDAGVMGSFSFFLYCCRHTNVSNTCCKMYKGRGLRE